jgi:acetylserotonin N-methyltransferase
MTQDFSVPDPAPILNLMVAFRQSKIMFAAVKLGLFDLLNSGPRSLQALAADLHASEDGLERLLNACVGLGLLRVSPAGYANTPAASAYLCKSSDRRLTGYIAYSNDVMWQLWSHLEDAVREGSHRWRQSFGWDGPIFSHFFRTDDAMREFLMGMHGYGLISSPVVVSAIDLSRFRRIVDLGGATGHLAIAACLRHPHMRGVVFDLPETTPLARDIVAASPVAGRVEVHSGDFFTDPLPPGDLYALGRIIHDWNPAKIDHLLRRVFQALPNGGGLLIAEKILDPDKTGPMWATLQNLNMLTCTEGKERTQAEYETILYNAGFKDVSVCRTAAPLDVLLAVKG